ncbi:MAG: NAD(P)/FAD-dependent oxidoreductase [Halanaerobiales bacterium]
MKKAETVVIGGGPAGMMAAGTAAGREQDVILLEKNKKPGKKLSITGKGRCNLTNAAPIEDFFTQIPVNSSFLYSALYTFSNERLVNFFYNLGLETKVERGNRVFPTSDRAEDVVAGLIKYINKQGVKLITNSPVKNVEKENEKFIISTRNDKYISDCCILAAGGKAYPGTGAEGDGYHIARSLGHDIIKVNPSLVPLEVEEKWVQDARKLTLRNINVSLFKNDEKIFSGFGEMEFTSWGVSGPLALSASSHIRDPKNNNYRLVIDLKPALSHRQLDTRIQRDFQKYSRKLYRNALGDLLPVKLIPVIIKLSGIPTGKPVHQITKEERRQLLDTMKGLDLQVSNLRPFSEAIITSGGINVNEIDPGTMESRLVNDLYFAGEIIDTDAYTGGYNLQIAFSTGYLAGINLKK